MALRTRSCWSLSLQRSPVDFRILSSRSKSCEVRNPCWLMIVGQVILSLSNVLRMIMMHWESLQGSTCMVRNPSKPGPGEWVGANAQEAKGAPSTRVWHVFSTVASGLLSTNVDEIPIAEGRSGYSYQDFRDSFRCQETEEALVEANLRPMPMWKIYRGHKKTSLGT